MSDTALPPLKHHYTPGTARAALSYRDFRLIWIGLFASNIGTWMQNVLLPAYIDKRENSGFIVGLMVFAQLGPLLLLSVPGGILADKVPRRPLLITMQSVQMIFSIVLAGLVAWNSPLWTLFVCNLVIGIGNALNAPAFQASIPLLVDKRDLPGAIALNSTMINGSRVIGPAIAALIALWGVSIPQIFVLNGITYLFVIAALAVVHIPAVHGTHKEQGWHQLFTGVRIARERPVLGRLLIAMTLFSFFSLPYVGLFPTVARMNFGLDPTGSTYKWLYATWGLGACLGALANATVLARYDKRTLIAPGFAGFAVCLGAFALVHQPSVAFPIGFLLGFFYFGTATSMITVLQDNMADHERARVMSLWFMAFGGTVPIGNLVFGPVIDAFGARWVLFGGALFAVFLAWWCNLPRLDRASSTFRSHQFDDTFEAGDTAALDENGLVAGE